MEQKLRDYVYSLFADAPPTAHMQEVREEICANVLERYRDLRASGASEQAAFESAQRSVGDVSEIIRNLQIEDQWQPSPVDLALQQKMSVYKSIGVALFILSPLLLIVCSVANNPILGLVFLFSCIAAGTALCVYAANMKPTAASAAVPSQLSPEEAEEFQQWRAERISGERRMKTYKGILWPLVVAAYFVISFATGAWYITWIIFLIGAALESLIRALTT